MLKIHELTDSRGELVGVYLRVAEPEGWLELVEPDGRRLVPALALEKVLARYGAPFDPEARITVAGELELGGGLLLRQVRHLAGYDVVERDYLVLDGIEGEALCAPGATVAAALGHLARAGVAHSAASGVEE
jgi:hypothetical protein